LKLPVSSRYVSGRRARSIHPQGWVPIETVS